WDRSCWHDREHAMKRRELLRQGTVVLLLGAQEIARGAGIIAVRIWPAPEYSRVTIESERQLSANTIIMANPPRLAVDIAGISVAQQTPGVVRLVVDLKQASVPQVFTLTPVAAYRHRLVFDFYPLKT